MSKISAAHFLGHDGYSLTRSVISRTSPYGITNGRVSLLFNAIVSHRQI